MTDLVTPEHSHSFGVVVLQLFELSSSGRVGGRAVEGRSRPGTLVVVARKLNLGPDLQAVVERAREQARESGELLDGPARVSPSEGLSPEARAALAGWVTSGDYDRAVAEIVVDDPDLQTQ